MRLPRLVLLAGLLAGCGGLADDGADVTDDTDAADTVDTDLPDDTDDTDEGTPPVPLPAYAPLPPLDLLVRASLDLRGFRPTLAEVAAVVADPTVVDALIDTFFDDPHFGARVRMIFDEVYLVRDEDPFVDLLRLDDVVPRADMFSALGEEPTRVLEHLAANDLPYTELVTADWTMANETTARLFPVDYPPQATGWQVAHYTDGRPAAGVLASNGLWWQHGSMLNNLNRGRANQISRIFLCADFLANEIGFTSSQALNSEAALGNAIRTDPACAGCHDQLDPLAASLFGFWWYSGRKSDPVEIAYYHPERERRWSDLGGLPPAFEGQPTHGLTHLGQQIADDPRYARCFAKRSWEGLLRRPPSAAEAQLVDAHTQRFDDAGLRIRPLYRDIVASDAYRSGAGEQGLKLVSAALLSSQVQALTGFVWSEAGWDLIRAPRAGYAPLVGSVDFTYRSLPMTEPAVTLVLVQKRLAQAASMWVVPHDLVSDTPHLLDRVTAEQRPETDDLAFRDQLVALHAAILSEVVPPDAGAIDEELTLWTVVFRRTGSVERAWAAVVELLLRDPRLLVY